MPMNIYTSIEKKQASCDVMLVCCEPGKCTGRATQTDIQSTNSMVMLCPRDVDM